MPEIIIMPYTMDTPCDCYGCFSPARAVITSVGGPPSLYFKLCDKCHKSLLDHIQETVKEAQVVEPVEEVQTQEPTGVESAVTTEALKEPVVVKNFVCPGCGAGFDTAQKLGAHKRWCPSKHT